jgi:hypothetical protein
MRRVMPRQNIYSRRYTISEHILASVRTLVLLNGHKYIMRVLCFNAVGTRHDRRARRRGHRVLASAGDISPSISHQNGISRGKQRVPTVNSSSSGVAKYRASARAGRLAC